jgi:hypothetical protein
MVYKGVICPQNTPSPLTAIVGWICHIFLRCDSFQVTIIQMYFLSIFWRFFMVLKEYRDDFNLGVQRSHPLLYHVGTTMDSPGCYPGAIRAGGTNHGYKGTDNRVKPRVTAILGMSVCCPRQTLEQLSFVQY